MELQCFTSSITNAASDQQINALADGRIPVRDNAVVVDDSTRFVQAAWFFGTNLTIAKLKPPAYRNIGDYFVLPIMNAMPGANSLAAIMDARVNPLELVAGDELPAYGQQGSAGAQQAYAFVLLAGGPLQPIRGKHYSVRATGSTTLVANAWTTCALTMDVGLPSGTYQCIGARAKSAGMLAFRIIFPNQNNRPGGVGAQSDLAWVSRGQRHGTWGEWGKFSNLLIPSLEVLSVSADTSEVLVMDLIKLS